jgi:hypothetical protein
MKPEATMQGMAMSPTKPILHSKTKAKIIPVMMVEKFMRTVEMREVSRLFTCLESTPKRVAACPPLFFFF